MCEVNWLHLKRIYTEWYLCLAVEVSTETSTCRRCMRVHKNENWCIAECRMLLIFLCSPEASRVSVYCTFWLVKNSLIVYHVIAHRHICNSQIVTCSLHMFFFLILIIFLICIVVNWQSLFFSNFIFLHLVQKLPILGSYIFYSESDKVFFVPSRVNSMSQSKYFAWSFFMKKVNEYYAINFGNYQYTIDIFMMFNEGNFRGLFICIFSNIKQFEKKIFRNECLKYENQEGNNFLNFELILKFFFQIFFYKG